MGGFLVVALAEAPFEYRSIPMLRGMCFSQISQMFGIMILSLGFGVYLGGTQIHADSLKPQRGDNPRDAVVGGIGGGVSPR